jgi:hypothetical protein
VEQRLAQPLIILVWFCLALSMSQLMWHRQVLAGGTRGGECRGVRRRVLFSRILLQRIEEQNGIATVIRQDRE